MRRLASFQSKLPLLLASRRELAVLPSSAIFSASVARHFSALAAELPNAAANPIPNANGPPLLPGPRLSSATPALPVPQKKTKIGYFSTEFFGGQRPTDINVKMVELPKQPYNPGPYKLEFSRYNGIASALGPEYYHRAGQRSPLTYYHMTSKASGDTVMVGSTDPRAREARTIDNYVKERTRGFATQIVLDGRGVKAFWEETKGEKQPKSPKLMVRLGVGAKVKDLSDKVRRDPDCTVHCNKKGDILVVHGPNKARVGAISHSLLKELQPKLMPYTGKGGHFAFHPTRRKVVRKK